MEDRPSPSQRGLHRREVTGRLDLPLDRLPTPLRETFLLRHTHGMEPRQTADTTGTPAGTAPLRSIRAGALPHGELGNTVDTIWGEKELDAAGGWE